MKTAPSNNTPTPSTNTVPSPKIEPPLPYSGSVVSITSCTKIAASVSPPRSGATPLSRNDRALRVSSCRK
jgi:hypothetical protein